jgi:hypothetical protein
VIDENRKSKEISLVRGTNLSTVIEVSVRHSLLASQLPQLVEEDMELVLGVKIVQAPVAETLERPISDHGAEVVHV